MAKPTYFLLMWKGHSYPNFCELDADEWRNVDENPQEYQIFVVDGHRAKVLVGTWERGLRYQQAMEIATCFILGAYDKITIDLKELTGKKEDGIPHGNLVHPPY